LAQTPLVNAGGVVDAASFAAPVAPGSLVSIFGSNLAPQTAQAATIPLPTSLAGVSVSFNGLNAPLLYVAPGQINAQLPFEIASNSSVNVVVNNNGVVSTPQSVDVSPYAPGVFMLQGYAVAIHSDGSLAAPAGSIAQVASRPAVPGEMLQVLATGLGPVNPPAITGNNSLDMLRRTVATPSVLIGGSLEIPCRCRSKSAEQWMPETPQLQSVLRLGPNGGRTRHIPAAFRISGRI
jgi:uncharacterized protein (TIGR03437 family)